MRDQGHEHGDLVFGGAAAMTLADRDRLILQLAERLWICSRLLTRAAERLGWETAEVQELVERMMEICK